MTGWCRRGWGAETTAETVALPGEPPGPNPAEDPWNASPARARPGGTKTIAEREAHQSRWTMPGASQPAAVSALLDFTLQALERHLPPVLDSRSFASDPGSLP